MFDWFHKALPKNTFDTFLEMILHLEKNTQYLHLYAWLYFSPKNVID